MADLISRQAAIDAVADGLKRVFVENRDVAEILLKSVPSAQPEQRWIPVTKRLPEVNGCYLVSVKNDHERRYSKTAWFEKDVWFARQDVIAWMPLPEPWKGEQP